MKPKVLALHNFYQLPGGEDSVFASETALLEANGHEVVRLTLHNDDLAGRSRLGMAVETIWNARQQALIRQVIRAERPDVMHCHNTFPQFSPAVYYAARQLGVPVVQTLHNFRLACVNGLLFRDGHVCTKCVGGVAPWSGIRHACYRGSRSASLTVAGMIAGHKLVGTYRTTVDRYIALTEFARERFIEVGLPAERVMVKPNFARDRVRPPVDLTRDGFLYVGRLSTEKGVEQLIAAARQMRTDATITIVGNGPLRPMVEAAAAQLPRVLYVGPLDEEGVYAQMRRASAVVIPSLCFENFPVVAAEACAAGCPVVASGHGGLTSIVREGETGRLFRVGDASSLATTLDELHESPNELRCMGAAARSYFERELSPGANYAQLMRVYSAVGAGA